MSESRQLALPKGMDNLLKETDIEAVANKLSLLFNITRTDDVRLLAEFLTYEGISPQTLDNLASMQSDNSSDPDLDFLLGSTETTARLVTVIDFKKRLVALERKILQHDLIRTIFKLGLSSFGWQFGFLLTLHLFHKEYNPHLNAIDAEKITVWLMTGIFASPVFSSALLLSQNLLKGFDKGEKASIKKSFSLRLNLSVFVADTLWQLLTDIGCASANHMKIHIGDIGAELIAAIFVFFPLYLFESFIFKSLYQECDSMFVGVLTGSYASFHLMTWAFTLVTGFSFDRFTLQEILLACTLAMIGTMILPALLMLGNNQIKLRWLKNELNVVADNTSAEEPLSQTNSFSSTSTLTNDLNEELLEKKKETFDFCGAMLYPLEKISEGANTVVASITQCVQQFAA